MLKAASNSGPIIHLNEINQLKLFDIFSELIIPFSVAEETGKINVRNIKTVKVQEREIKNFIKFIYEFNLQKAEIDALYLAKKYGMIFLTDDLQAREAAKTLKIEVHGTLGIITLCYNNDLLNLKESKELIWELYKDSTLFLTRSLVDLAINKLEKN